MCPQLIGKYEIRFCPGMNHYFLGLGPATLRIVHTRGSIPMSSRANVAIVSSCRQYRYRSNFLPTLPTRLFARCLSLSSYRNDLPAGWASAASSASYRSPLAGTSPGKQFTHTHTYTLSNSLTGRPRHFERTRASSLCSPHETQTTVIGVVSDVFKSSSCIVFFLWFPIRKRSARD